uniref:Uncharacterized protein n=1 Tax=Oryza nivara TaxID=4536 RepID=A0A0E0J695_ORYNI
MCKLRKSAVLRAYSAPREEWMHHGNYNPTPISVATLRWLTSGPANGLGSCHDVGGGWRMSNALLWRPILVPGVFPRLWPRSHVKSSGALELAHGPPGTPNRRRASGGPWLGSGILRAFRLASNFPEPTALFGLGRLPRPSEWVLPAETGSAGCWRRASGRRPYLLRSHQGVNGARSQSFPQQ